MFGKNPKDYCKILFLPFDIENFDFEQNKTFSATNFLSFELKIKN